MGCREGVRDGRRLFFLNVWLPREWSASRMSGGPLKVPHIAFLGASNSQMPTLTASARVAKVPESNLSVLVFIKVDNNLLVLT